MCLKCNNELLEHRAHHKCHTVAIWGIPYLVCTANLKSIVWNIVNAHCWVSVTHGLQPQTDIKRDSEK